MLQFFKHGKVVCRSIVKPLNDTAETGRERANEDYADCRIAPDGLSCVLALADGAGGYSVFASDWAKALVTNIPVQPICSVDELDEWLNGWWEQFYENTKGKIPDGETFLRNKFYKEGSAATLCVVWFADTANGLRWDYMCMGDSVIFRFNFDTGVLRVMPPHLQTPEQWEAIPSLINWVDAETDTAQLSFESGVCLPNDCWLIASDALAQYIWVQYLLCNKEIPDCQNWLADAEQLSGKLSRIITSFENNLIESSFTEWFASLMQAAEQEHAFSQLLYDANRLQHLLRDDYSLAFVQILPQERNNNNLLPLPLNNL